MNIYCATKFKIQKILNAIKTLHEETETMTF